MEFLILLARFTIFGLAFFIAKQVFSDIRMMLYPPAPLPTKAGEVEDAVLVYSWSEALKCQASGISIISMLVLLGLTTFFL